MSGSEEVSGVSLGARAGRRAIRGYQFLWAGTTSRCRFAPTCSQYAHDAIGAFGLGRGSWMAMKRIGRCHPWHPGGYDPVVDPNIHSVSGR